MKLFWTGTDSLMLVDYSMRRWVKRPYWWLFRRLIRFMDRYYVQSHYCDSPNLVDNLMKFGVTKPVSVVPDEVQYHEKFPKVNHAVFTVLYYFPIGGDVGFNKWQYGKDVFEAVVGELPELRYIIVNGSADMEDVYPYVDFYLRPNRHDGASRMRQECEIQDIPYYWTQKNPSAEDAIRAIKKVMEENNQV